MSAASVSLRRLFDVVQYLIDDRVGIIHHVDEVGVEAGAPQFFHFSAQPCNTGAFGKQENSSSAGGAAADRGRAMAKAIGEAVERYCSALYDAEEFPLVSFESAPFPCVRPSEFALYSPEQYCLPDFPFVPFAEKTPMRWAPALDMTTRDVCHVPAARVFVPYYYGRQQGELPIAQPISTGLACHCSWEEAAISAICEVVERDAFTITWQACLGMPHIHLDTLSEHNQDLVVRFERTGAKVTMLNVTLDHGIPTILSVLHGAAPDAPALVFAASAHPDPEEAARKSLEELAHTRALAHQLKTQLPPIVPDSFFTTVKTQDDHVHLYCDDAHAPLAQFIFSSRRRIAFDEIETVFTGDPTQDLRTLIDRIREVNHRVLIADLTTPDVGDLGLSVVRAVIPGFHPLALGHRIRALGGSRLWEIPQKLGYPGITKEAGDNPAPHPYP